MSTGRIGSLTDGVFAIVMTLLVFDLRLPQEIERVAAGLEQIGTEFIVFIISFVILGQYWVSHHSQVDLIRRADQIVLWSNIAYLLGVSLVPSTSRLLGRFRGELLPVVIYTINLSFISVCHYIIWRYSTEYISEKARRYVPNELDSDFVKEGYRMTLVPIAFYVAAVPLAEIDFSLSLLAYALVPVYVIYRMAQFNRRHQELVEQAEEEQESVIEVTD